MNPALRKFVLTAHIAFSVSWLGAVLTSLAVALIGLTSDSTAAARGSYLVLEPLGRMVLVPLSLATLVTGVAQGLGTRWGLLRHYWVLVKLGITVVAATVLVVYLQTLAVLAVRAAEPPRALDDLNEFRSPSPAVHAVAALVLLLAALVLSVYKPRGLTRYGQRTRRIGTRPSPHER
jgi:hypothetical protein